MSYSVLGSAACIFAILQITTAHYFDCNTMDPFSMPISSRQRMRVFDVRLDAKISDKSLFINSFAESDSLEIYSDLVLVRITGKMTLYDGKKIIGPKSFTDFYQERLSGTAHSVLADPLDLPSEDCRIVLLPTGTNSSSMPLPVARKLRRSAESCIERKICQNIEVLRAKKASENSHRSIYNPGKSLARDVAAIRPRLPVENHRNNNRCDSSKIQETVDALIDIGLDQLVKKLQTNNVGTIILPDVKNVVKFLKVNAALELTNGTLSDITTLRRRSNAVLSRDGLKFIAGLELGLDVAQVEYKRWKLKYGLGKSGKLSGKIDGIALAARFSVDYEKRPCTVTLDHLNVTQFGKVNVSVKGFGGPLNSLISSSAEGIINGLRKQIVHMLENKVVGAINSQLSKLNCEQFRP